MTANRRRAVFLDRDGVLVEASVRGGRPCPPASLEEFRPVEDAATALERLKNAGFVLIVVTNQPDVARGTQNLEVIEEIHSAIAARFPIDDILVCCHDDADHCACRKPKPGLLIESALRHGIDLESSFLIGDRWRDIDAGFSAGCRTILLDRHYSERLPDSIPDYRAASITEAVDWILAITE